MYMRVSVSWKWVVLWSLWAARVVRQPTAELRVSNGLLRGSVAHDGSHLHYHGIPYATVGPEHRFKAPGPEPTWEGVFDAIDEYVQCPQRLAGQTVVGQENCLVLNVYTPLHANPDSRLPVMVFIHGGGFFHGSGSKIIYGPEYLVAKEVILITINYRLNIQGFLCLRTEDAPGNAGMKDQVAALRWVQRNIEAFGGDPDNVTLFGESAGAASVSYHLLSPMTKGLFHKAIIQSGSSLAPWAYQLRPVYMASLLTKTMGYKTEDPKELYQIIMNKTDEELIITRVPRKEGNLIVSEVLYAPCTEEVIDGVEPFLTEIPYEALSKGKFNKVPLIIGANSEEGLLFARRENDTTIPKISFEKSLPKDIVIHSESERKAVAAKVYELYMGDDEVSSETILKLSRLHGELYFNLPSVFETEYILNSTDQPVYNYFFNHSGWRNLAKATLGGPFNQVAGATHADELFYLFKSLKVSLTLFENEMIDTMTTLWTNFAKYSNPTPAAASLDFSWPPSSPHSLHALVLGSAHTQPLWHTPSLHYWRELYHKYRRKHY
ncbi:acetylcholinesterase-like [Pectinophora gossypiella]|uniref:acetylcholinesterase-like n=1 Tax=Pectinophora gossypiella TaxID=13191 RepID=UPI00214E234C|nr:acetylcholinesterase-like [Pectinophora gossypiella]